MSRPQSGFSAVPSPTGEHQSQGYGANANTGVSDFAQGNPNASSPLSQSMSQHQNPGAFSDDLSNSRRGSSAVDGAVGIDRTTSTASTAVQATAPSRSNTLKKKSSMRRANSLKRSNSKRSLKAGSLAGFGGVDTNQEFYSAFSTPIPTQGSPTEILANRFQQWRHLLKSLIAYFREIQASYETRAKATNKIQNALATLVQPPAFMEPHGLADATRILDDYHKKSVTEANKSREIENDVIGALTGLRSDLGQKIKEIKSLSGDFKNSVEKEKDGTRREVEKLQEALQMADRNDGTAMGKNDPFVVRLGVDRTVEKQIDEENYLHRAYLNLESSGRELESIVVGEIQKAYNALAGILKREGDDAYNAVDSLRSGPIALPKDSEWTSFVQNDAHFVDPSIPLRRVEDIEYPGKHHPAAAEVRAGMLERKSKYLKSYTPGWYVLSPTHLHEFKSADKIYTQPPVMSLYLPDQKLGSRSQPDSSSHKFMVKGKQSGNMHKGHNWVFRAETYDTMVAWFDDMSILTEKTGEERNAYVRKHARSFSGTSERGTVSSDGLEEDEADQVPYSADVTSLPSQESRPQRPQPGGRFPSDMQVPRARNTSVGQSSAASSEPDADVVAMAGPIPGSAQDEYLRDGKDPYRLDGVSAGTRTLSGYTEGSGSTFERSPPLGQQRDASLDQPRESFLGDEPADSYDPSAEQGSQYGQWTAPIVAGTAGAGGAVAAVEAHRRHAEPTDTTQQEPEAPEIPPKSERRSSPSDSNSAIVSNKSADGIVGDVAKSGEVDGTPVVAKSIQAGELGGLEKHGAHETGAILPRVIRHNTDMSISQLHIPGEFPKQT